MVYRCILPQWNAELHPDWRRVYEGELAQTTIHNLNTNGYNIYFLPNHPSVYTKGKTVDGADIDVFNWVFVDFDLKSQSYPSKDAFIEALGRFSLLPTLIADSGNGVHAYWQVNDLDAMGFLRLQRRLIRHFNTDEAIAKIYQLMRVPGTYNTKAQGEFKLCEVLYETDITYTSEDLSKALLPISQEDEDYCRLHFEKTYKINAAISVDDKLPLKFAHLIEKSLEAKKIWAGELDDRSKGDYRLGHLMFANGFTKDEAMSVLVNCAKALARGPTHRVSYAQDIVEKIWTYELAEDKSKLSLSSTVKEILDRYGDEIKGTRFPCWKYIDATEHGFRLGQVIGLVAGSGVGKTAMALNMFKGFVQNNPDYDHFFVPLEQPANEIAGRWKTMCGENTQLYHKVHIISNYAEDGSFRHLSFDEIKEYILKFQQVTKRKVGAVVIDHIGALKKKGKDGENQDLMDICHRMKGFAVETNTMLIMQSQAPREKAGIGDLELNKDAAYGTVYFESYCDYLITIWQPLKRCYADNAPTVTAFKFCKIRHKKQKHDNIQEDVCYRLFFESETEHLRELTQAEEKSFTFFLNEANNKRKKSHNRDEVIPYHSMPWTKDAKSDNDKNTSAA